MNKETFGLYLEGLWMMKWLFFPFILGFTLYGLYEAIENKWERRVK